MTDKNIPESDSEAAIRTKEEASIIPVNPVQALMTRMDAHETEGEVIDKELERLGLNPKKVNSIRSTQKRIAKEQAALANMLG